MCQAETLQSSVEPPSASQPSSSSNTTSQRKGSPTSVRSDAADLIPEKAPAVWSSGVPFYPPSKQLWRIGGKWYDFEPFLKLHPGGSEVVKLARDRFEDATYAFESHHHNYSRARKVISKYEVETPAAHKLLQRPAGAVVPGAGGDGGISKLPELLDDTAFYSVVRQRLTQHLGKVRCPRGGPTYECCVFFWANFAAWCLSWLYMYTYGTVISSLTFGALSALLGAFGHNWVHQPDYRIWAYLSLDTIGFSSTGWFREHVLQHHMCVLRPLQHSSRPRPSSLLTSPPLHPQVHQHALG